VTTRETLAPYTEQELERYVEAWPQAGAGDASHWVHHDEAERVNRLLIEFLGRAA
jgi:hypothetical protein